MGSHLNREGKRKRKEKKRGERERAESQRSGKKGLEAVTRLGEILITRPRVKEREGENGENRAALARARVQKGCNAFGRPKNSPRARVNFLSSRGRGRREGGLRLKSRLRFKFR